MSRCLLETKRLCGAVRQGGKTLNQNMQIHANRHFLRRLDLPNTPAQPIFFVGPPRCGSTLLYQALVHAYQCCFFTNEMMKNPRQVPMNISLRSLSVDHLSSFTSTYGQTEGDTSPHEGWSFWRRFYPRGEHDYVDGHHLGPTESMEIYSTIRFMESHYGRPYVSKNIETVLRLRSLQKIFPKAVFVVIKRDPRAIASSILEGRVKLGGSKKWWMGMRPENYQSLTSMPVLDQVANQILAAYTTFYKDIESSRYIEVRYEDFCDSPNSILESIVEFLRSVGIDIKPTKNAVPEVFHYRKEFSLSMEEERYLTQIFLASDTFDKHLCFELNQLEIPAGNEKN